MIVRLAAAIGLLSGSVRPPPTHRAHIFASANTSLLDKLAAPIPFSEDDGACLIDEFCIYFVTGNAKKQREVNAILSAEQMSPFRVTHVDIDLPELQGDPIDIAKAKCREAAKRIGGAVVIEDTSLCFSALNGLPGPYIKWFVDDLGNDGLYKLLAGHEDHSAYCQCALAFSAGPGTEPLVFVGRTDGEIVAPIGEGGFGWDAIFLPEDSDVHFAEMTMEEKNKISHRARAFKQFVAHCKEHEDQMIEAIIEAAEAQDQ